MRIPRYLTVAAAIWIGIFWIFCIAIPLTAVLRVAGTSEGLSLLFDPILLGVVRSTLWQASLSTILSGIFGGILGLWIGRQRGFISNMRVQAYLAVPFCVPAVVAGIAWISCLGRSGILTSLGFHLDWVYHLKAVVLAHVFLNAPMVALLVAQATRYLPVDQLEAIRSLGAGKFTEFRFIIWPSIRWALGYGCSLVMVQCSMSFALVMILGGGPPVQTLETELYQRLRYGSVDRLGASVCAVWEMAITLAPWAFLLFFESRQRHFISDQIFLTKKNIQKKILQPLLFIIPLAFISPYFTVINEKFFEILTSSEWRRQLKDPICISFLLAGATSVAAVITALWAVLLHHSFASHNFKFYNFKTHQFNLSIQLKKTLRSGIGFLLGLPSGISVLVLSLGVWTAYGEWLDLFEGNIFAIIALQTTLFFPVAFRLLRPVSEGVQFRQLEAAVSLGAPYFKAFWVVEWPRWKAPLFSAFSIVAGSALGEVAAVSLFYTEKFIPLPLLISRHMSQYRFEEAQGVAGLLFLFSLILTIGSTEVAHWARKNENELDSKKSTRSYSFES